MIDRLTEAEKNAKAIETSRVMYIFKLCQDIRKKLKCQWVQGVISRSEFKERMATVEEHFQLNV